MGNFSKKYSPAFEKEVYEWRSDQGYFKPKKTRKKDDTFVVTLPPPNVTGKLHLGHSIMLAIQDVMVRFHRMSGKETVWIPGTDHASISTQVVVEKKIAEKGLNKHDLGREAFLKEVREWVTECRSTITGQIKSMGASVDREREQFTVSEELSRSVRTAFKKLYEKEKVYKGTYMVNRSPGAQTVLSDLEVEHKEVDTKLYYIRYFVQGKGDSITVATIRPETIFADVAIAVHPKDRRYKKRIGRNVLIPIVNRPIPVIADESVQIDFGTGALKITPTHSEVDFEIAQQHELPMDRFSIDRDNIYTDWAGEEFAGKDAYEFMDNLIQYLNEIGNLDKIEDYKTTIPTCERTGVRVQPLLSQQWFMNVKEAAEKVSEHIHNEDVQIHPPRFGKTFHNRLDDIKPRCISRQLRRGQRIPVRYDETGKQYVFDDTNVLDKKTGKKSILAMIVFNLIADSRLPNPFSVGDLVELLTTSSLISQSGRVIDVYCKIYSGRYAGKKTLEKEILELKEIFGTLDKKPKDIIEKGGLLIDILQESKNISILGDNYKFEYFEDGKKLHVKQETDVLDTWFSSALRPFSTLGRPEETKDLERYYPNTVLETGYDIILFWVIKMMFMGIEITDQMPFEHVYLHGLVRAEDGQKMSKSKGNGIDPIKLIDTYGADALRGALLLGNTPGNDQKFSEQKVDYVARFINKLWNASRYVSMNFNASVEEPVAVNFETLQEEVFANYSELSEYDAWMLGKLYDKIGSITRYQKKFMIGEALQESITLVWHELCDWYIEISKLQPSPHTKNVMLYVIASCYKLLHPSLPFVTEKLRSLMGFEGALIIQPWLEEKELSDKNYRINMLMDMISQWRTIRQQVIQKPHEKVMVFVQGNKDIHLLVEDHQDLIRDIVRVEEILFIDEHQETPEDYSITMLMDIKLGVKGIQERDWKESLLDLEKQVKDEEEFLQRMRVTLGNPGFMDRAPKEVVDEKKKKMEEVKSKISKLHYEINKIKMTRK